MNVQMTPSFLSGRDQFTTSELSSDMVKCKLRYISETNFARVTDENLLTDVIPASCLFTLYQRLHIMGSCKC